MSKRDAVIIASRILCVLFIAWALTEISYLPEFVDSYRYYANGVYSSVGYVQYMQQYHLLRVCFLIVRIVGYLLLARWLYKAGPDVQEVFLPEQPTETGVANSSEPRH